jgi:hypothetical protein
MRSSVKKQATTTAAPSTRDAKRASFERLAARRVNLALKTMKLIANLANRRNYEYTDEHARQIIDALESEVRAVKAKFAEEKRSQDHSFEFKL